MTAAKQRLEPGSTARIYRDGGVLVGPSLLVPTEGRFEVRHLDPGHYVARDESGNEVAFEVSARDETTVIVGSGTPEGPTGAPGTGRTDAITTLDTGAQKIPNEFAPEHSPAARRRKLTVEDAVNDERRAPAAPGSVLVDEVPDDVISPVDEAAWAAAAPQGESVDTGRDAAAEQEPPAAPPKQEADETPASAEVSARPSRKAPSTADRAKRTTSRKRAAAKK